jgi:hypothetical protein
VCCFCMDVFLLLLNVVPVLQFCVDAENQECVYMFLLYMMLFVYN